MCTIKIFTMLSRENSTFWFWVLLYSFIKNNYYAQLLLPPCYNKKRPLWYTKWAGSCHALVDLDLVDVMRSLNCFCASESFRNIPTSLKFFLMTFASRAEPTMSVNSCREIFSKSLTSKTSCCRSRSTLVSLKSQRSQILILFLFWLILWIVYTLLSKMQ